MGGVDFEGAQAEAGKKKKKPSHFDAPGKAPSGEELE